MEDNMNKRMGMTGSDRFLNEQSSRNNNLNNTQSINRVGVNASQARLNSALRARKYGETQSMNYVNPGMQNRNNARNMGEAQSRNNVQSNMQRNHNYSVQDDWSGKETNRVQSYNTQKLNTPGMKQMQQRVQAQSNQSYDQPQDMVQSKQQNVMNDSQTQQQSANRGPQRPGVSASTGTMYPVPYNMTPNQDVSARRSAIRTNVIEENNMMAGEARRPQYDNIPVYFDDKKKKFNKKTLIPIAVCFMLVAVAGMMVATTIMGSEPSEASVEEKEKKAEKTGDISLNCDKVVENKIVNQYGINASETTREELAQVDKLEILHDKILSFEWLDYLVGLKLLRMKECYIDDRVIKTIPKGALPILEELDLSDNTNLGNLEFVKDMESLKKIDVTNTAVSENKINELKEHFKEVGQDVKINSNFGKEY